MRSPTLHLVIALTVLFGVLGMYGAWYGALSKKSAVVASLENQISEKLETAKRIAAARAALAEIAGDESAVRAYFVSETGVVPFIDDLEKRGRAQGATVSVLSVANATDTAHTSLDIALSVKGSFDSVMRTLGSIEYAPYALTLSSAELALDAKDSWHANVTVTVGSAPSTAAAGTASKQQ